MSQQKKLEKVLDLLLSEDQNQAAELLHQIIVEKARTIYERIVEEEEIDDEMDDVVGGDPDADFTDEISADQDEISSDEENDGEPEDMEFDDEGLDADEGIEDRVDDLETQLADLRAEFDALMDEEMLEPNHADLADEMGDDEELDDEELDADELDAEFGVDDSEDADLDTEDQDVEQVYERVKNKGLEVAPQFKKSKKGKKVDEETQFLKKVADTGQKGTAKLVGTGKHSNLGAEQNASPYTRAPSKKDFGGKPVKMASGTGGEYGKYSKVSAKDDTPSDNTSVAPKKSSVKAASSPKYTGGKSAGTGDKKSPLSKKPG